MFINGLYHHSLLLDIILTYPQLLFFKHIYPILSLLYPSECFPNKKSSPNIIWANYNNSLTWIKAIWGWFLLLTMIIVRSQWGRYNLPRYHVVTPLQEIPAGHAAGARPPLRQLQRQQVVARGRLHVDLRGRGPRATGRGVELVTFPPKKWGILKDHSIDGATYWLITGL